MCICTKGLQWAGCRQLDAAVGELRVPELERHSERPSRSWAVRKWPLKAGANLSLLMTIIILIIIITTSLALATIKVVCSCSCSLQLLVADDCQRWSAHDQSLWLARVALKGTRMWQQVLPVGQCFGGALKPGTW